MKKFAKKLTVVVSLVTMMTVSLAGCSKKTECENCGETKKCKKVTVELLGQKESGYICDDCMPEFKASVEMFGGTVK